MLNVRAALARVSTTRQSLAAFLSVGALLATYFWRLGSLTSGKGPAEAATLDASRSLHGFSGHVLNLPHNFLLYVETHFNHASIWNGRAVSALFALAIVGCFYYLMKVWFGSFVGYIAAFVFAFTPLVILAGRSMSADILILLPLCVSACYFWTVRSQKRTWKLGLLALLAVLCLYVPGGFWLIISGAIYAKDVLRELYKQTSGRAKSLIILAMLVLLTPLGYALAKHPAQFHGLLLIPASLPGVIGTLKSIAWMAVGLFWHTKSSSDYQIGTLGLLSLAQIVLGGFGVYAMWARARAKSYALLGLIVFGVLMAGLNSMYPLLLVSLVGVSVFVAAGLRFLLLEWRTVFPRNPLPRGLAIILFCALLTMQVLYGVRYSLIAWPHTAQVRQSYVIK